MADAAVAPRRRRACVQSLRRPLVPPLYEMRSPVGGIALRCFPHALLYRPMLRRSLVIALIVGTILTAINQGNVILGGGFPPSLYWKIPLTYCVPFGVATTGALLNARTSRSVS